MMDTHLIQRQFPRLRFSCVKPRSVPEALVHRQRASIATLIDLVEHSVDDVVASEFWPPTRRAYGLCDARSPFRVSHYCG
jgi:hypothetical protein